MEEELVLVVFSTHGLDAGLGPPLGQLIFLV
jgi:hypothetical protein